MTNPLNLSLGQHVSFTHHLKRTHDAAKRAPGRYYYTWERVENKPSAPSTGVYSGIRFKQEGYATSASYDEAPEWTRTGTIPCALITYDERKAPLPVAFEDLTPLPNTGPGRD